MTPKVGPPSLPRRASALLLDLLILTLFSAAVEITLALNSIQLREPDPFSNNRIVHPVLAAALPAILLMLVVPLRRRDRATPGQVCVKLQPSDRHGHPLSSKSTLIRFAVRWTPFLVLLFIKPALGLYVVLLTELLTVCLRPDRRSLSSVLSHSKTSTHKQS